MAVHLNEVSKESRAILADVRTIGKRVMERFYEGFGAALKDVHRTWRHLRPQERKIVFEKVQDVAKEIIVDKEDGGGADDGLALSTFYQYVCKVKRALIYNVPLDIAERATNAELEEAFGYIREEMGETADKPCNANSEKVVAGYRHVKAEQVRRREVLRQQAAEMEERRREEAGRNGSSKITASIETPFTLPDPDSYETSDEESDALLQSGIQSILTWLYTKNLQPHLEKQLASAKVLKTILAELTVYENQQKKVVTVA
jgi:hypothetical protein